MLEIINNLRPFFEDCYRRISVREYARLRKVSPPTASALLSSYVSLSLLRKEKDRNYHFFSADRNSSDFVDLSRMYWRERLSGLVDHLKNQLASPIIILFGSLSKAEVTPQSDVDLLVVAVKKKETDLAQFESALKRPVHLLWAANVAVLSKEHLWGNIVRGYVLEGGLGI